jgi:predicted TIM-barrel fold metal-dependent hydrolase
MIIDWQHHWYPEKYFKEQGGIPGQYTRGKAKDGKTGVYLYDALYQIEKHLEIMDAAGVDIAVLSGSQDSYEETIYWNNQCVEILKKYPKRFEALTRFSPSWGEAGVKEIDRAVNELGFRGIVLRAQSDDHIPLDSPDFRPFYRKMSGLDLPIFVHVSYSGQGFEACKAPWESGVTLVREFDLTTATARLVLSGVLEEFPNLKFAMAHFGGGIATIWERIERYVNYWGPKFWGWDTKKSPLSKPINDYFSKIYFDMAGFEGGMNAVKCALTTISPQRLLFGTDYPPNFVDDAQGIRKYIDNIRKLDLDKVSKEDMLGNNAARLLHL